MFVVLCDFSAAKESFRFQTKYLETFSVEDANTLNEAKEEAVNTIIDFVKASDMFQVSHVPKESIHFDMPPSYVMFTNI